MDLLFKRYADPFLFMDQMLQCGRFYEFVVSFKQILDEEHEEDTLWDFYIHRIHDKSFEQFKKDLQEEVKRKNTTEADLEATVKDSYSILDGFKPEAQGGA